MNTENSQKNNKWDFFFFLLVPWFLFWKWQNGKFIGFFGVIFVPNLERRFLCIYALSITTTNERRWDVHIGHRQVAIVCSFVATVEIVCLLGLKLLCIFGLVWNDQMRLFIFSRKEVWTNVEDVQLKTSEIQRVRKLIQLLVDLKVIN